MNLHTLLEDDSKANEVGNRLIELLSLKVVNHRKGMIGSEARVNTNIGDKTPAGLARTVLRLLEGGKTVVGKTNY